MKRTVLTGLAALTLFDVALAVTPAAAGPATSYNWTGFYVGGHAGYRWADSNFSGPGYDVDTGFFGFQPFPSRREPFLPEGAILGIQAGYNYLLTPRILAGVEGDWTWGWGRAGSTNASSLFDQLGDGFSFRGNSEVSLPWQATIRARLGYVDGPWLIYGTAGIAFAHVKWSDSGTLNNFILGDVTGSASYAVGGDKTLTGWVIGIGVEYMLSAHWIARLEYLHENFGSFTVPFGIGPQSGTLDLTDVNKLRGGLSYKF